MQFFTLFRTLYEAVKLVGYYRRKILFYGIIDEKVLARVKKPWFLESYLKEIIIKSNHRVKLSMLSLMTVHGVLS
jgi:hypothetical protein